MASVLIVDDEASVRSLMARWVQSIGYSAKAAENAENALAEMSAEPAAVAVCDIRMPGHDGFWLAGQLRERYPGTAVIMATGARELDPAVTSLRAGVVDYLVKPFGRDQLRQAVERGLDWHHAAVDACNWRRRLEQELRHRQGDLTEVIAESEMMSAGALDAMLAMLTTRDGSARDHAHRVARLSVKIALALGVTEPEVSDLERAALMHDLGKLAMPEAILRKPAALSHDERQLMHEYPAIGFEFIHHVPFLKGAATLVLAAREWFNGYGYPNGLEGKAIPLGSRIIAVADAYDVMTHPQIYRDPMSQGDAVQEIQRCSGTQFDPAVVDALLAMIGNSVAVSSGAV